MLDNEDRVSSFYKGIKGTQQSVDIMKVKTGCRFVKDKECGLQFFLPDKVCQFYTLILTTRKSRRTLSKFDVAQTYILE